MQNYSDVSATDALKLFGRDKIQVQVATPVKVTGDDGKVRESFKTDLANLKAEHVLSCKKWESGAVTLVTIDGQRYTKDGASAAEGEK